MVTLWCTLRGAWPYADHTAGTRHRSAARGLGMNYDGHRTVFTTVGSAPVAVGLDDLAVLGGARPEGSDYRNTMGRWVLEPGVPPLPVGRRWAAGG